MQVFGFLLSCAVLLLANGVSNKSRRRIPLLRSKMINGTIPTKLEDYPIVGSVEVLYKVSRNSHYRKHLCTGTLLGANKVLVPMESIMPLIMKEYNSRGFLPFERTTIWTYRVWNINNRGGENYFKFAFTIPRFKTFGIETVILPTHPGQWHRTGWTIPGQWKNIPKNRFSTSLAILQIDKKEIVYLRNLTNVNENRIKDNPQVHPSFFYSETGRQSINCHIQTLGYSPYNRYNPLTLNERLREDITIVPVEILDENCEKIMNDFSRSLNEQTRRYYKPPNMVYDKLCMKLSNTNSGLCRGDEGAPILCKTNNTYGTQDWYILGVARVHFKHKSDESCKFFKYHAYQPVNSQGVKQSPIIPITAYDLREGNQLGDWVQAAAYAFTSESHITVDRDFPKSNMRWTHPPTTTDAVPYYFIG